MSYNIILDKYRSSRKFFLNIIFLSNIFLIYIAFHNPHRSIDCHHRRSSGKKMFLFVVAASVDYYTFFVRLTDPYILFIPCWCLCRYIHKTLERVLFYTCFCPFNFNVAVTCLKSKSLCGHFKLSVHVSFHP